MLFILHASPIQIFVVDLSQGILARDELRHLSSFLNQERDGSDGQPVAYTVETRDGQTLDADGQIKILTLAQDEVFKTPMTHCCCLKLVATPQKTDSRTFASGRLPHIGCCQARARVDLADRTSFEPPLSPDRTPREDYPCFQCSRACPACRIKRLRKRLHPPLRRLLKVTALHSRLIRFARRTGLTFGAIIISISSTGLTCVPCKGVCGLEWDLRRAAPW